MGRIDDIDLGKSLSKEESATRVLAGQRRLTHLRLLTAGLLAPHQLGPGVCVLFEGFDAAGKGGAIRRLTGGLDPRHVLVRPVGPPSAEELRHHFLWRFSRDVPGRGEMTVFDRSWYGRLLVERVEGLIDDETARRSAAEIVTFEKMLVESGTTIVKLWLHVSADEQLRRFEERATDPMKQWKLTEDDWRNREARPAYLRCLADMVEWTDHAHAHWDLIAAENKHYARAGVIETVVARWEKDLARRGVAVPPSRGRDYLA